MFFSPEHIELPAKLLDYFLRSNKSNINKTMANWQYRIFAAIDPHENFETGQISQKSARYPLYLNKND